MPEIIIIGKDFAGKNFDFLKKHGDLLKFTSLGNVRTKGDDNVALLIIEKEQHKDGSFKSFSRLFPDVPKLIVSSDYSFRGFAPWLKMPRTFPVHNPEEKEMLFLADRLISEGSLSRENGRLKSDLLSAQSEITLFEAIGKILTSDKDLDTILLSIMKQVKGAVHAASWSIFLLDEETGEVVLEKTDDKKKKAQKIRLRPGEGAVGWVVKEGMPLIFPDVPDDKDPLQEGHQKGSPSGSLIYIPIISKGQPVGAIEFTGKPTSRPFNKDDLDLLVRIVDYAAVAIKVASLYQKMAELSVTDDLTKLFNSRYLNRTIEVEIQRCERSRTSVSLIFMDIDNFKHVNDHHGHLAGSKLLVEVGQLLLRSLRSIDIVARYGGDEFVIVLPQTAPDIAAAVAERVRKTMDQNIFLKKEGFAVKVTASFGVASYPESAKSKEDLLRLADEAMYRVKNASKNGVYAII